MDDKETYTSPNSIFLNSRAGSDHTHTHTPLIPMMNATFMLSKMSSGLPWWFSGKESTYQFKGHGFHPWARKTPRAMGS